MALKFLNRVGFSTPFGTCVCPVFYYPSLFPRAVTSFTLYDSGDYVALAGYSSFIHFQAQTLVAAPEYGSICSTNTELKSLIGVSGKYDINAVIYGVSGSISTRAEWAYNYGAAPLALADRIGMPSGYNSGSDLSRVVAPLVGLMTGIMVIIRDAADNAIIKPILFANSHIKDNPDLVIYSDSMPTSSSFGVCSISGEIANDINIGNLSTDHVTIPTYEELIEILDLHNITEPDPYEPGGESERKGGDGDYDDDSDDIPIPGLPTISAVATGFVTLFNPSASQLRSLADYMWNNNLFDLNTWKKIFDNPMDAIMGLSIVPVSVPSGGTADVTVGNIITTVSMTKAGAQYIELDCGSIDVNEYWGAYLDYDPYTKVEIYLPYCGTHALKADDVMGKTVKVVYHVDILSGACVAFVKCGSSVLYQFIGQCASAIPISGSDMTNVINGVLSIAGNIGMMVATGGASTPISSAVTAHAIGSTAANCMAMKPAVEKSGAMAGTGGMLAIQTPYLILTRPNQCLPAGQNGYTGYPSYITEDLDDLFGFTVIEEIHMENMSCTDSEKDEIERLLKTGVIM